MEHHNLQPFKLRSRVLHRPPRKEAGCSGMYKKTAEVCNNAATTAVATNLSYPLLFIQAEKVTTGAFQQKDRSFVLSETLELLHWRLRTPNATATPCTQIKFSFFFPVLKANEHGSTALHLAVCKLKILSPSNKEHSFFFFLFLSKCIQHMYTHTNKSSCDLPSPPISKKKKKKKLLGGKKRKRNESRPLQYAAL